MPDVAIPWYHPTNCTAVPGLIPGDCHGLKASQWQMDPLQQPDQRIHILFTGGPGGSEADDGMAIVKEFPKVKGVFHCYSGSAEMARQLVNMGWYIGFTGVLTFKNAKKLKLICVTATGYDNIDLNYARENSIAVCNVRGYSTDSVCQVTVSMALYLLSNIYEYEKYVSSGEYTKSGVANRLSPVYHEISGKTWGIVGLGNIGRQVAKVAEALGCKVICHKRTEDKEFRCVSLETLMRESDIISVHVPLSKETENMIDKEMISLMKKESILINVARGAVCDEAALCEAVRAGRIAGIGIDVYSKEPFSKDSPYNSVMHLPNVCLLPHMAWGAYEARERCVCEVIENINAFFNGEIRNRVEMK